MEELERRRRVQVPKTGKGRLDMGKRRKRKGRGREKVGRLFIFSGGDGRQQQLVLSHVGREGKTVSRSRLLPSALSRSAELGSVGALFSLLLLGIRIVFRMCVCVDTRCYHATYPTSRYSWLLQAGRGGEIIIRGFDFTCQVFLSPSSSFPPYCVSPFAMFVFSFFPVTCDFFRVQ